MVKLNLPSPSCDFEVYICSGSIVIMQTSMLSHDKQIEVEEAFCQIKNIRGDRLHR